MEAMVGEQGCAKRLRPEAGAFLVELLHLRDWDAAIEHITHNPRDAAILPDPSPLALACRYGAPCECVRLILEAAPDRVRHVLDSRGTPLHEAAVCEKAGIDVIAALLEADEALGLDSTRATLQQDVDGYTPLHLLIRRRFQSHIMGSSDDVCLMEILEMLVSSCPEAVVIPDRGEYEEPPIVYAIKATIYAPMLGSEDDTLSRVERQIYEMVRTMLKHAPFAAAQVFTGFRGQYTALHSAVFHGRYTSTIDLLLRTEKEHPSATHRPSALLTNTQLELPLHFCAMRGERPPTVALLAKSAPEAVLRRDASGLTPFHWLWIRFASTLLALDDTRRGLGDSNISLRKSKNGSNETNKYNKFAIIEGRDVDSDLLLIKRLDPPVDFLHMRNIPREVSDTTISLRCADQAVDALQRLRGRQCRQGSDDDQLWTRQEAVMGLFWTKSVSLIEASAIAEQGIAPVGDAIFVHTAFATSCCLPPVARIAASLFPEEMRMRDERGRLPLHYAASRSWSSWDLLSGEVGPSARLLQWESLTSLRVAFQASPTGAVRVADNENFLVLHLLIDNFVKVCSQLVRPSSTNPILEMLNILQETVRLYPGSLFRRDGNTKLYPFLQATAAATEYRDEGSNFDHLSLSFAYELLRENPTVLRDYSKDTL